MPVTARRRGGGAYQNKVEVRWIKADRRKALAAVKEEGWRVYGAPPFQVWIYSARVMDCERAGGNKAMSMRSGDKLI